MNPNWAEENLQTIRTLMERSAVYRRALAPIMIFVGIVGVTGGIMGWWIQIHSPGGFVLFWVGVAMVALAGAFFLVRRQALKNSEPFWSPPTKRVTQALLPPFIISAFLTAIFADGLGYAESGLILISIWCLTFGCALHSAGFFMPRGMKIFGWLFILVGCLLIIGLATPSLEFRLVYCFRWPHLLMGGIFGGLHFAYGIYLYFTEKKNPIA
jgi:hypothetical protein